MSSPLTVKRRRLNDATQTLSKPFVSPMRAPDSINRTPLKPDDNAAKVPSTPSTLPLQNGSARPKYGISKSSPLRKQYSAAGISNRGDPAEMAAQKAVTALEFKIKAVRNELEILNQAAGLVSSAEKDAELKVLSAKWRIASQQAADELFGVVQERVHHMGGVKAWRESERRKQERAYGWDELVPELGQDDDADCEFDSQGEELPETEQESRRTEKRRIKREMIDAAESPHTQELELDGGGDSKVEAWRESRDENDGFSMDMMLRSLNVDLKTIGYDKQAQRWIT